MNTNPSKQISRRELLGLGLVSPLYLRMTPGHTQSKNNDDFVSEFDPMWERTRVYTMEVAQAMPEEKYSYRPVPEVRSFAEAIMHITGTNYGFSDVIRGNVLEDEPNFDVENKTRAEMLELLNGSFDVLIDLLISLTPQQLEERVRWQRRTGGESTHSKRGVALTMWHHVTHHRAKLVVYLRMNGIEAPGYMD